jgi:hypothetical protein
MLDYQREISEVGGDKHECGRYMNWFNSVLDWEQLRTLVVMATKLPVLQKAGNLFISFSRWAFPLELQYICYDKHLLILQ